MVWNVVLLIGTGLYIPHQYTKWVLSGWSLGLFFSWEMTNGIWYFSYEGSEYVFRSNCVTLEPKFHWCINHIYNTCMLLKICLIILNIDSLIWWPCDTGLMLGCQFLWYSVLFLLLSFSRALSDNMHNFSFGLKQLCKFLAFMISREKLKICPLSPVYLFSLKYQGKD